MNFIRQFGWDKDEPTQFHEFIEIYEKIRCCRYFLLGLFSVAPPSCQSTRLPDLTTNPRATKTPKYQAGKLYKKSLKSLRNSEERKR